MLQLFKQYKYAVIFSLYGIILNWLKGLPRFGPPDIA